MFSFAEKTQTKNLVWFIIGILWIGLFGLASINGGVRSLWYGLLSLGIIGAGFDGNRRPVQIVAALSATSGLLFIILGINRFDDLPVWLATLLCFGVAVLIQEQFARQIRQAQKAIEAHDVSAKKATQELQVTKTELDRFYERSIDLITISDFDSVTLRVNPAVTHLLGYTPEEFCARPMMSLVYTEDIIPTQARLEQLAEGNSLSDFENRFIHKDGSLRWMAWTATPFDGLIYAIGRDITERKKLQEERVQFAVERETVDIRQKLLSIVSHEFRNPLAVISTSNSILQRYYDKLGEDRRESHLQQVAHQVDYMAGLIDRILLFNKLGSDNIRYEPQITDLEHLCHDVIDQNHVLIREQHNLHLDIKLPDKFMFIDPNLMRYAMSNLLSNALKYSPEGGNVFFRVWRLENLLVFEVEDQGIGIPLGDQGKLFTPFHRGSNTQGIKGTGMGLAIVRESINKHHGEIYIRSGENAGTTITVRVPLQAS